MLLGLSVEVRPPPAVSAGVGGWRTPTQSSTGSGHGRAKVTRWLESEPAFASKTLNGQVVLRLYLPSRVLIHAPRLLRRGSFLPEKMPTEQLFLNYPFLLFTVIRPLDRRATVNKFLVAQYIMVDNLSYYLNPLRTTQYGERFYLHFMAGAFIDEIRGQQQLPRLPAGWRRVWAACVQSGPPPSPPHEGRRAPVGHSGELSLLVWLAQCRVSATTPKWLCSSLHSVLVDWSF